MLIKKKMCIIIYIKYNILRPGNYVYDTTVLNYTKYSLLRVVKSKL